MEVGKVLYCKNCKKIRLSFKFDPSGLNKRTKRLTLSPMDFAKDDKMTKLCTTCEKPLIYTEKDKIPNFLEGDKNKQNSIKHPDKIKDRSFFDLYVKMIGIFSEKSSECVAKINSVKEKLRERKKLLQNYNPYREPM